MTGAMIFPCAAQVADGSFTITDDAQWREQVGLAECPLYQHNIVRVVLHEENHLLRGRYPTSEGGARGHRESLCKARVCCRSTALHRSTRASARSNQKRLPRPTSER